MKKLKINKPYITLGQLLKMTDFISSGGQAKIFLAEYADKIFVNGVLESRRGKKLYSKDIIKILDQQFLIE